MPNDKVTVSFAATERYEIRRVQFAFPVELNWN